MSSTRTTLTLVHSGKIRELYALPDEQLLLLASDNVSAYDRVLPTPIPGKGAVLTQLTTWWLSQLSDLVPNHLVSTDVPEDVAGRALVVEKLDMISIECVVRGYLAGSAWKDYSATGTVAGITLPTGLLRGERLERPIFTPAVKAPQGSHDENISYAQLVELVGVETALELRRASLRLYVRAERIARERGLILVDTKFEFGRRADGTLVLADEVLTPDSSRYWASDSYAPGTEMPSLDKQQLRDWITGDSGWDPDSGEDAPALPDDVVSNLSATYADTYQRLTGTQVGPSASLTADLADADDAPAEPGDQASDDEGTELEPGTENAARATERAIFIVDVMLKEDIHDAQGAAITEALTRLGYEGFTVRQGKRFEVVLDGELTQERLDQVTKAAEEVLVHTEVEDFEVSLVDSDCGREDCAAEDGEGCGDDCACATVDGADSEPTTHQITLADHATEEHTEGTDA